nr:hypothetical protein RVX_0360 [Nitratidesulfovibrio sp. HK-II]
MSRFGRPAPDLTGTGGADRTRCTRRAWCGRCGPAKAPGRTRHRPCRASSAKGRTRTDRLGATPGEGARHVFVGMHGRETRNGCSTAGSVKRTTRRPCGHAARTAAPDSTRTRRAPGHAARATTRPPPSGPQGTPKGTGRARRLHPEYRAPESHTIPEAIIKPNSCACGQAFLGPGPCAQYPPGHRSIIFQFRAAACFSCMMQSTTGTIF